MEPQRLCLLNERITVIESQFFASYLATLHLVLHK